MKKLLVVLLLITEAKAQLINFPLKASSNHRYLVDQTNQPIFLKGTATWRLSYMVSIDQARSYLEDRKKKDFNSIIVEITPDLGRKAGNQPNIYGQYTFDDADVSKPNEKYFAHVDSVLQLCNEMNFVVLLFPLYLGCCKDGWLEILQKAPNTVEKCRDYGKWVANRYKHLPNIIWMSGGDHNETPESIAFAEGLSSIDTTHLHSYHGNPGFTSTERLPDAKWLTLSCTYTYIPAMENSKEFQHVYGQIYDEYANNKRMPYIMSESAYEYERNETTQILRRQAYWALLGGCSGHIFGNRDSWMMNENWSNSLNTPGNQSMKIFHNFLTTLPWYNMIPDWEHTMFTSGRGTFNSSRVPGGDDYATGAMSTDKTVAVLYIPTARQVCVNLERFNMPVLIKWFDPTNGEYVISNTRLANKGVAFVKPPAALNSKGFDDWVLIATTKN